MSSNGHDSQKHGYPSRPRHHITRSITEVTSPVRASRHHHNNGNHKLRNRDDKGADPASAAPFIGDRRSLDLFRSEAVTPSLTPSASRRQSVHMAGEDNVHGTNPDQAARMRTQEEELKLEQGRAIARTA